MSASAAGASASATPAPRSTGIGNSGNYSRLRAGLVSLPFRHNQPSSHNAGLFASAPSTPASPTGH